MKGFKPLPMVQPAPTPDEVSQMRRLLLLGFGLLELALMGLLAALAYRLPATSDVTQTFERAELVTYHAGNQVQLFRQQARTLRRAELHELAQRLQQQTAAITA